MRIPVHKLMVYNKPKLGTQFIKAYRVQRYKHKISAMGGFDTASCQVIVPRNEAEFIYETMIGNRVAVFVDNPAAPIWEGLISRITFNLPGVVLTRSLDQMANRLEVAQRGTATTSVALGGAPVNNTASQAIYGIKQSTLRATAYNTVTGTYPTALITTQAALLAYPQSSAAPANANPSAIIELEMIGIFHTLEWESRASLSNFFNNAGAGVIPTTISGLANGATFFDNTNTSRMATNTSTYDVPTTGATAWQHIKTVAEAGDASGNRWIAGISGTGWNTRTRIFYYQMADTSVKYTTRLNDGGRVRTIAGALVHPWSVTPDGILRIVDALVGWDGTGADPREVYLAEVTYDADSQRITWASDDSIEMQGALQARRLHTSTDQLYAQRASNPLM